jgi:hypothetical protein
VDISRRKENYMLKEKKTRREGTRNISDKTV